MRNEHGLPAHLLLMVERAIAQRRMATENVLLKEELAERRGAPRIVGDDPKLRQVSHQLQRAAATSRQNEGARNRRNAPISAKPTARVRSGRTASR